MTTFLLIRHGNTDLVGKALAGRQQAVSINETGKRQAHQLIERLRTVTISAIYSSPLDRAVQTAGPLSEALRLPIIHREALAEIDFGAWTGRTLEALREDPEWKRFNSFRSGTGALNGESILDLQRRMVTELEYLRLQHPTGTVALFSHGELIRSVLIYFAGIPIDLSLRVEISPASITAIGLADWGAQILTVNNAGQFS